MPVLNFKGHHVPANIGEAPSQAAFSRLSRSILDPIPVANAAARTAALSSLASASPSITPSTTHPIYFHQADLPKAHRTIVTVDGTNFISTAGLYVWANSTERTAATGMVSGDRGVQLDTGVIYRYSGSAWTAWESNWATFNPSLANLTVGSGGGAKAEFLYRFTDGRVHVKFEILLGTTGSSVGTHPTFTLPTPSLAHIHGYELFTGNIQMRDASDPALPRMALVAADNTATDKVRIYGFGTASTGLGYAITPTVPWTWAAGDTIAGDFIYDPA